MSERGQHSGRGRGGGRGDHRGGRGGGGGGRGGAHQTNTERPKKENILDLGKYMDKKITVKFNGGREGSYGYRHALSPTTIVRTKPWRTHRLTSECSNWYPQGIRCAYESGFGRGV